MTPPTFYGLLDAARRYRLGNASLKFTFQILMEHMGNHGDEWACWPGIATLAEETEQGTRTVTRHLAELEATGLIEKRRQAVGGGGGRGGVATTYVLNLDQLLAGGPTGQNGGLVVDQPATHDRPTGHSRQTNRPLTTSAPYIEVEVTKEATAPEAQITPLFELVSQQPPTAKGPTVPTFEDFYAAYPLHKAKGDARKAWAKASKATSPSTIIEAAARYAADPNRDPAFTKHPASWLNAGCWEDEPCAPRANGSSRCRPRDTAMRDTDPRATTITTGRIRSS